MTTTEENFLSPFWDDIADAELVTSRAVIPAVTKAGKSMRQNFAVLHETLYSALLKKAGSTEQVIAHAQSLHTLDALSLDYLRKQLAQCALIRDVLKADVRQVAKQYEWEPFLDYAADDFSRWAISNPLSEPANAILQFDIELLAVLYRCFPDCVENAVEADDSVSEDAKKPLIHALRVYEDYDYDDFDEDEDDAWTDDESDEPDVPAFSSSVWPELSAALSPEDRGLFLSLVSPLAILLFVWARKELDSDLQRFSSVAPLLPPCASFNRLVLSIPADEINADGKCFIEAIAKLPQHSPEEEHEVLTQASARIAQAIDQLADADRSLFLSFLAQSVMAFTIMLKELTRDQIDALAKEVQLSYNMLSPGIRLMSKIVERMQDLPHRSFAGELPAAD